MILKSAGTSAQSDQSLHCPHEDTFHSWLYKKNAASESFDQTARISQADLNLRWAHMSKGKFSDDSYDVSHG